MVNVINTCTSVRKTLPFIFQLVATVRMTLNYMCMTVFLHMIANYWYVIEHYLWQKLPFSQYSINIQTRLDRQ